MSNAILALQSALLNALGDHPHLALAQAVVCLDPCHYLIDPDESYYDAWEPDLDDAVLYGLLITRREWPEVYVQAVHLIRQAENLAAVGEFIVTKLANQYPFLSGTCLQELPQGPMHVLPFCGTELLNPVDGVEHEHFIQTQSELANMLVVCFGVTMDEDQANTFNTQSLDAAHVIAMLLARHLREETIPAIKALATLFEYIFGATGNELADMSVYGFYDFGFTPLDWNPEDLEVAQTAVEDLEDILKACDQAKAYLQQPDAIEALKHNVQLVRDALTGTGLDLCNLPDWRTPTQAEETRRKMHHATRQLDYQWPDTQAG